MNNKQIAMKAIKEGMQVLRDLARETRDERWINHSVPRHEFDELALELGYSDALEIERIVEDKEREEEDRHRDMYPGDWHDWV